MYAITMEWKEFNVSLSAIDAELRAEYPEYAGNQANSVLELWFNEEPSQEDKDAVQAYWDAIESDSSQAVAYQSAADESEAREAIKESGKAKLAALGLTADEIAALVG